MFAFLLNLDAEGELRDPGAPHDPFAAIEARPGLVSALAGLVPPGGRVLGRRDRVPEGTWGLAFCPTPRALRALAERGARLPPAPGVEVLRAANHRALEADLEPALPGARFVRSEAELGAAVAQGDRWLLKEGLGHRGGARQVIAAGGLAGPALTFARRALATGGLMVQPYVERLADFALHGFVDARGLVVGQATKQEVTGGGTWRASAVASRGDLSDEERRALERALTAAAEALVRVGYGGPFGIDAFRYRVAGGEAFCPRCEINARYSMGWAVGMGALRPDLALDAPGAPPVCPTPAHQNQT